jgi:ABC-type Fe3+/spermidine/putrescine transport system ATPase subunit
MLEVSHVSAHLGQFSLDDVSLTVEQGQYLCLAGPTGAGKTVLLECVAGLHRPDAGDVRLSGSDVTRLPPERRGLGYVPQDYALFPHMDVFDNIAYGLVENGVRRSEIARKVESTAELLRISHLLRRDVVTLSGGERQRVALARTLVLDCRLLLLDEPLSALDGATTKELGLHLAELHRTLDLTVVHVTHDFNEAFSLASHIGICDQGRLLQIGTVQDVFTRPNCRTVADFLGMTNVFPRPGTSASACPVMAQLGDALRMTPSGSCVCIRPDQIRLTRDTQEASDVVLDARVSDVRWFGPIHEVTLDVGVPLLATISEQEQHALRLRSGDPVRACVDRSAVHVSDDR